MGRCKGGATVAVPTKHGTRISHREAGQAGGTENWLQQSLEAVFFTTLTGDPSLLGGFLGEKEVVSPLFSAGRRPSAVPGRSGVGKGPGLIGL
jgi:hypothetical protein